jgi:hypothetical protein
MILLSATHVQEEAAIFLSTHPLYFQKALFLLVVGMNFSFLVDLTCG